MRSSANRTLWILGALLCAGCNGRLAVLNEPIDGAEGTDDANTGAGAGSGGTEGGSATTCDLSQWRPGSAATARPIECGVCSCENGEVVCEERPCLESRPIVPCVEDPYSFETTLTWTSRVVGQSLHAETMGPGGCAEPDYHVCYELDSTQEFLNITPRAPMGRVVVRTSPEQAVCDKVQFQTFDVDLRPMQSLLPPNRGALDTGRGYVVLGDLTCADYTAMAANEASLAGISEDNRCEIDSDCVTLQMAPSCGGACYNLSSTTEFAFEVEERFRSIEETLCQPYLDAQCSPVASCDGQLMQVPVCIDGHCGGVYVE